MKNYTLKLTEAQMEMLGTALDNFDINEFLYNNPQIEERTLRLEAGQPVQAFVVTAQK